MSSFSLLIFVKTGGKVSVYKLFEAIKITFAKFFKINDMTFEDLGLNKPLLNALSDLNYTEPTTIQAKAFGPVEDGTGAIMGIDVDVMIGKLSPARREEIEARAAALIAEETTLREMRRARKLAQARVAKALGITHESVSRLGKRSDLFLSTLKKTVEGMGGSLSLMAQCPDGPPVVVSGLADDVETATQRRSRR